MDMSLNKYVNNFSTVQDLPSLDALLDAVNVKNGWAKAVPVIVREPNHPFVPHRWRYAEMRAALEAAGRLVATEWAERRNLIMANPYPGNAYATTPTLVGAYQMVKAGERAVSHRHTPNAMRIVLEAGSDTYTVVDGKKIPMLPGDVLLTPNWCYHGHSNEGVQDAYWIDILDSPLVAALGPMFFQCHPDEHEVGVAIESDSPMRFAFADYRPALLTSPRQVPGVRLLTLGSPTQESLDRVAIRLEQNIRWEVERNTANQIYVVVEGRGQTVFENRELEWQAGDMIAAPSWQRQTHFISEDAILIRISDEPLIRMLGWYRTG
jgi:gentisate 1,2-dioxygenase